MIKSSSRFTCPWCKEPMGKLHWLEVHSDRCREAPPEDFTKGQLKLELAFVESGDPKELGTRLLCSLQHLADSTRRPWNHCFLALLHYAAYQEVISPGTNPSRQIPAWKSLGANRALQIWEDARHEA